MLVLVVWMGGPEVWMGPQQTRASKHGGGGGRRPWGLVGRTLGSRTGDRVSGFEVRPCVFTSRNLSIDLSFLTLRTSTQTAFRLRSGGSRARVVRVSPLAPLAPRPVLFIKSSRDKKKQRDTARSSRITVKYLIGRCSCTHRSPHAACPSTWG